MPKYYPFLKLLKRLKGLSVISGIDINVDKNTQINKNQYVKQCLFIIFEDTLFRSQGHVSVSQERKMYQGHAYFNT